MSKININKLDLPIDELDKYCCDCIFFNTEECIHYDDVFDLTEWRGYCDKFYS